MDLVKLSLPLLWLALVVLAAEAALPLPDYVRPCSIKLSDRKMSKCAVKRAREIIPSVAKGDSKYKIPVLDPMHIDRLVVIDGKPPLGLKLLATDVKIYGIPKMIIHNTTHQTNPKINTYVATIPEAVVHAKYNISGQILLLPVIGEGNAVMTMKNLFIVYQFDWALEKLEDGEVYYIPLPGERMDADCEGMSIELDNLFNGDKALLDATNKYLNDEWREVFNSLKPSFAKSVAKVIADLLNGIFRQVPFKDAFLDVDENEINDRMSTLPPNNTTLSRI